VRLERWASYSTTPGRADSGPNDDPESAARIFIEFIESPAELERAGRAAMEKFLREYDANVVAPRLLSFLPASSSEDRASLEESHDSKALQPATAGHCGDGQGGFAPSTSVGQ